MFIVFEGVEGGGKSTQVRLVSSFYEQKGYSVLKTREPGGTATGEKVRSILLDNSGDSICRRAELLLYMASRSQLVEEVLKPAQQDYELLICDRYLYSSVVYQGYAGGLDTDDIMDVGIFATDSFLPDIVFLLDLDVESGMARITGEKDRMESESIEFHEKVRQGFLSLASEDPEVFKIIDADRPPEEVFDDIMESLPDEL